MPGTETDILISDFKTKRALYEAFSRNMESLIDSLLRAHEISHQPLEVRTKSIESFASKVNRPNKQEKYEMCEGVTDLSGVRIVVYYEEDALKVAHILADNFDIDYMNSVNKADDLPPTALATFLAISFVLTNKSAQILKKTCSSQD